MASPSADTEARQGKAGHVFLVFLRLGLTSFGGPIAHLGYFRNEFVARRRWLSESEYAGLVALCQFLPGPASSQVGMAIGLSRAGLRGALAAWCGFTLPSALAMIAFAYVLSHRGAGLPPDALHGMKLVAVAVVAQAVWGMARTFCRDAGHALIALVATVCVLSWPSAWMQVGVIALAGIIGLAWRNGTDVAVSSGLKVPVSRRLAVASLVSFLSLLIGLPLLAAATASTDLRIADAFYRTGALVFGGGHVVLPLLRAETVLPGWISAGDFLAGYGAAQALPGPLFTFAAFLGTAMKIGPGGWGGGLLCLLAIFLPSLLLVLGVLPFWENLRQRPKMRAALAGVNAAVVGLLLAALYDPLWTSAVGDWRDILLVIAGVAALMWAKWPPWVVVLALGAAGFFVAA
ncbi:chromate efflux transporter [Pseudoxanthomonas helianthi]|uniref:Chromate efflux transporter n=1 Tax=Pseudoxanthomonas helianthi TaxID=1453541 RepID=A0A940X4J8_9GAMM|nr:chromate efflux transporter [Pseudoxanthomonas helianthi]MBP3984490.1 chromate efflux transporter [Pseudoxanthomonas helianthi]